MEKEWMSPEVSATVESNENRALDDNLDFKVSTCIQGTLDPTWDEELKFDVGKAIQEYTDFERAQVKKKIAEESNKENEGQNAAALVEEEEEFVPLDPKHTINLLMKIGMILYVRDADPYYNNNEPVKHGSGLHFRFLILSKSFFAKALEVEPFFLALESI